MLVYSANGELGDALVERIRPMTKEVEVGDEYTGKVVKTTTFGAFIELAKGTDGLLHISNVSPGSRVATVEEVLSKGDEVTCAWSRSTVSAAGSACASPTTLRSPARASRNSRAAGTGGGGGGRRPWTARGRGGDRPERTGSGRPRRDRDGTDAS